MPASKRTDLVKIRTRTKRINGTVVHVNVFRKKGKRGTRVVATEKQPPKGVSRGKANRGRTGVAKASE